MRLTIWQFVGLIVVVAIIWFVMYTWAPSQDSDSWIDRMNSWFMKEDPKGIDEAEGS